MAKKRVASRKAKQPVYSYRPGSRVHGVEAQVAGEELARLREANDGLTPEQVLDSAGRSDSPLHDAFEWDDSAAAREYRLQQARTLLRAVFVTYTEESDPRPVYVYVPNEEAGAYQPITAVVRDASLYERALKQLQDRVEGAEQAVADLVNAAKQEGRKPAGLAVVGKHLKAAREAIPA